jgi:Putative zinc-finger
MTVEVVWREDARVIVMGKGTPQYRCRWVRGRLPLLDGGELTGTDRRKVESHLLGCPDCRSRRESLAGALGALHAASETAADLSSAPSLWPSLQRQIRETRHEPRAGRPGYSLGLPLPLSMPEAESWLDVLAILSRNRPRPALRLPIILAASLLVAGLGGAGVELWIRARITRAQALVAAGTWPISAESAAPEHSALDFGPNIVFSEPDIPTDRSTASRFGYDLDHGTPMDPDASVAKPSY